MLVHMSFFFLLQPHLCILSGECEHPIAFPSSRGVLGEALDACLRFVRAQLLPFPHHRKMRPCSSAWSPPLCRRKSSQTRRLCRTSSRTPSRACEYRPEER